MAMPWGGSFGSPLSAVCTRQLLLGSCASQVGDPAVDTPHPPSAQGACGDAPGCPSRPRAGGVLYSTAVHDVDVVSTLLRERAPHTCSPSGAPSAQARCGLLGHFCHRCTAHSQAGDLAGRLPTLRAPWGLTGSHRACPRPGARVTPPLQSGPRTEWTARGPGAVGSGVSPSSLRYERKLGIGRAVPVTSGRLGGWPPRSSPEKCWGGRQGWAVSGVWDQERKCRPLPDPAGFLVRGAPP